MDPLKLKDKYLDTLFFKSRTDYLKGFDENKLWQLIGLDIELSQNLKNYLTNKGLIEKSRYKGDERVILTTEGFDYCLERREKKRFKTIRFTSSRYLPPTGRTTLDFAYYYDLIDENGIIENKTIIVSISFILSAGWGYQIKDLEKILLHIAKDKLIEKIKEGTLTDFEEVMLLTNNAPSTSPYDPQKIVDISDAEFEVELEEQPLSERVAENKLAASIIEMRDIINAVFYEKHKQKLLLLNEERNLLDFFKPAYTEEEFSHRIASLGEISRNLNLDILRKVTAETDTSLKSIQLLDKLLTHLGISDKNIPNTLKYLGRIRQGYPIHTDIAGVIEGLRHFEITYPIQNYEAAWQILLENYLTSLKELYKILSEKYLSK
jgi:hypothetical protein